ncbi:hypothetical protein niasHT_000587 [Heterodera trifolii]|uniref:B30.2/SPRY domain-containing protein n=1 Tax=Heterodera trifolii TaxID=157864 RepID=A0ABD2LZ38_9BILA
MSISTSSIYCGDDLTATENREVNGDVISLDNDGQFDGKNSESIADQQQQLKEFREKFARIEMELKMAKLELENVKKMAKLELENKEQKLKLQEMMVEQKALKEKVAKIEQKKEKNAIFPNLSTSEEMSVLIARIAELNRANTVEPAPGLFDRGLFDRRTFRQQRTFRHPLSKNPLSKSPAPVEPSIASSADLFGQDGNANAYQFSTILEKISELEKQQKHQHENTTKANSDQFSKMQNDQKIILEKINELEKEQKQKKALLNFRQNYWDANVCHEKLEIIGHKNLIAHYNGNINGWSSVFAKHPILLNNNSPDIFYYEISVKNIKSWYISFGFSIIQQTEFEWVIKKGTYAYDSHGVIWINGKRKEANDENSYGVGATVGIGVNSATRQIFFTKNGLRLGFSDFYVAPSFADDSLHPFVSLFNPEDKIEANFGPNLKFDLAIL